MFCHIPVTPALPAAPSRRETPREFLAKRSPEEAASQAPLPPTFQSARAQFPAALSGLAFVNLQKIDYQALKTRWIEQAKKASAAAPARKGSANAPQPSAGEAEWLLNIDPQVFVRHLHFLADASCKSST